MNTKIRLGFVGCGRISQKHFESLDTLKDYFELAAVCDDREDKAREAANNNKCKYYTKLEDLLSNEQLDLVTLATPNGLHAAQIKAIASRGINVVSEKPLAINWKDGLEAYEVCKKNKAKLFIIHQNRFNDTIQHVWKAIQSKRFGKIYMITSNVFWQRPQDYFDKDATWHGTKAIDGGAFMTQASHYVDMIQWLSQSEPESIYAVLDTLGRNIETEDSGSVIIKFKNKIISSINLSVLTYPRNLEGSINIIGEKGTVKIGGVAMNKIEHWEFLEKNEEDEMIANFNYETSSVYGYGHARNYQDIFQDLRGDKKALIDGNEGLKTLKILCAILDTHENKAPINFS